MFDWIHAENGFGPIFFYLAIVVVWTVFKKLSGLAQRKKERGDPREAAPAPPRTERRRDARIDPALKEFLESLTGQKIEVEPPAPPAETRPLPIPRRETTPRPSPRIHPAYQTPAERLPPPKLPRRPEPVLEEIGEDAYLLQHEVSDFISRSEIGEHEHITQRLVIGNMSALAALEALRIPMPSMNLPGQRAVKRGDYKVQLRGHDAVEHAIVQRVIMGPPKAMGLEDETWCANL